MKAEEAQKRAMIQRLTPQGAIQHILPLHKPGGTGTSTPVAPTSQGSTLLIPRVEQGDGRRAASNAYNLPVGYTPFLEGVDRDMKTSQLSSMRLPSSLTTEDFTRAVAVATVSALRHQGSISGSHVGSAQKPRPLSGVEVANLGGNDEEHDSGAHEAPSWTRGFSAGVLLGCTLLYAIIAGMFNVFSLNLINLDDC